MTTKALDVFSMRDTVVREYARFATSFTTIHAPDINEQVRGIYSKDRYWPEPLLQLNPHYVPGPTVADLVANGVLVPEAAQIFRTDATADEPNGVPLRLHKHQQQAISLASAGESYVVTTGTGSGKSLCFFIPIVNAVIAHKKKGGPPRTQAIIIYPMNALANSQLEEIEKYVKHFSGEKPITFARYTGQENSDERQAVADHPPDILLTNFMMLELLMTRQDDLDRRVVANCAGLRFLVLDELHTYRGRQGADVALLVRRVRERLAPEKLQCIGTSATMANEGTQEHKNRVVAAVASKLFATVIPAGNVVVETLQRVTDTAVGNAEKVKHLLGPALDQGLPSTVTDSALRNHPLAIWVETRLGITFSDADQRWIRAQPLSIQEAAIALAVDADRAVEDCRKALRHFLLISSTPEDERTGNPEASKRVFFAFKLHQFVSGAGHAFSTLETPGERTVTVDAQQFLPGAPDKRLYPLHFCRDCGHEYHPVRCVTDDGKREFLPRDIDDAPVKPDAAQGGDAAGTDGLDDNDDELEVFGFLTPQPADIAFSFSDKVEDYPDGWLDYDAAGEARLKSEYKKVRVTEVQVAPNGKVAAGAKAWFLPGKFRFCLRCGATHAGASRDRNRLSSLSAEGRSSATTVLVSSALRWMHSDASGMSQHTRKLLAFTDNRQDAALQAGHFNDFIFVSLIRAGFLGALEAAGPEGLGSEQLGEAQRKALGFDGGSAAIRGEWLLEPGLKGFNLIEAETTLRQVLSYRVWFDQRRGWRFTNPNLEQLKLVEVEYLGLQELAEDQSVFEKAPDLLRFSSPRARAAVIRELLDYLRRWMAIRSQVLDMTTIEQIVQRAHSRLRSPWGFGNDEKPRPARWLMLNPPHRREVNQRDEDLLVRGSSRSGLGKILRSSSGSDKEKLWDDIGAVRALKPKEFDVVIQALLEAAREHGLVSEEVTPFGDKTGWRLVDGCVRFRKGPGSSSNKGGAAPVNRYFRDLYENLSSLLRTPGHPLFGFEARPHTAAVPQESREVREQRFRYGAHEQATLAANDKQVRELGENNRFLPLLFCSPTMELGVDISALNAVYLRNVPPTPANYAQRSGRAGRSGQAALVLTYCSAQGPHDQYFFRDPKGMVHGTVRPPLLDLANRDLVESHLFAVWLACTEEVLPSSIAELLVLQDPTRPLLTTLRTAMAEPKVQAEAVRRIRRVLDLLVDDLTVEKAPWFPGPDAHTKDVVDKALARFSSAFHRWRDLFSAAEQQRDAAHRTEQDYAAPQADKKAAKVRYLQAIDQLRLLQQASNKQNNDFYTYRYLATEGFLPGYNFPRLPLMAYVPASADGKGRQTFLQRPRFLALSEFGPRSLVYHEGRAYRVVRAMLSLDKQGGQDAEARLPTQTVRICKACGGGHFDDKASLCHACGAPLADAEVINHIYAIQNVATQAAERITANDEERQRQGFELQTTFQWAVRDHIVDKRNGVARDADGDILRLVYGPGATINRLNKGLRRRANRNQFGFRIDPVSGYWAKNADEVEEAVADPTVAAKQWIVPSVKDQKNALLVKPDDVDLDDAAIATLQHALLRGIETVFQLEEGEVLAEPMPQREERTGFLLYEATEGGAGVLTRLVSEPASLAEVAKKALSIMHFDVESASGMPPDAKGLSDLPDTRCVAACYRCLMSYFNQPDHERIDRRNESAKQLLLRLARSTVVGLTGQPATVTVAAPDAATTPPETTTVPPRWTSAFAGLGLPSADAAPLVVAGSALPLAWRSHYVVATLTTLPSTTTQALADKGFDLVVFGDDEASWPAAFAALATALGRAA